MEKYPVKYSGPRDDDDAEQPTTIRCRQCGNESYSTLVICPSCGRELVAAAPRGLTYGLPLALIALFFIVFIGWSSRSGVGLSDLLPSEGIVSGPVNGPVVELEPRVSINETPEINVPSLVPEATEPPPESQPEPTVEQVALASATPLPTEPPPTPEPTSTSTVAATVTTTTAALQTETSTPDSTSELAAAESAEADSTAEAEQNVITVANLVATLAAAPKSEEEVEDATTEPETAEPVIDETATSIAVATSDAIETAAAAARLTAEAPPTLTPTLDPTSTPVSTATATATEVPTEAPTTTALPTSTEEPTTTATSEPTATEVASDTPEPSATVEPTVEPTAESTRTATPRPTRTNTPAATSTKAATARPSPTVTTATPRNTSTPTVPPTPTVSPTPTSLPIITHEIRGGDTLLALARQYGTTVATLMEVNSLTNDDVRRLRPGQELIIPAAGSPAASAVRATIATSAQPTEPPTATPQPEIYIMQSGDNPLKIAQRYGISVEALLAANGLTRDDATTLRIGTELVIPATSSSGLPSSSATQGQAASQPVRRSGTFRLDAPILLSPENQTPMSCKANDSLVWAPVPFLAPADSYLLHVGFVSAVSENGEETTTWILEQPRDSTRTSWDLDTDYCSLAPQNLGRQWRWYVEVLDKDGNIVSPPSPIWAFSWN